MGTGVATALKIIHWLERPYYITVFRFWILEVSSNIQDHFHSWNQNVFTHLESSAAEEEVEDKQRSHCEPAEITKCLNYVGFIVGVIKGHCKPAEITKCLSMVLSGGLIGDVY